MTELEFLFPPPPVVSIPVAGSVTRFPVNRIYCVGRNYLAHIKEMNQDEREPPFFFQKPRDALVSSGASIAYPGATSDFQYEVELVLAIGTPGSDIPVEKAAEHIVGLAVGIDLTRRDLQVAARNSGRPWESGKSFDRSAVIGSVHLISPEAIPEHGEIILDVDGERRQQGDVSELIWKPAEIVSKLSELFALQAGDLIYTGTPAGVGPVLPGEAMVARITGLDDVWIKVAAD